MGKSAAALIAHLKAGGGEGMRASISVAVILMYSERCLSWWYPFKYPLGLKNTGFGDRDTQRL